MLFLPGFVATKLSASGFSCPDRRSLCFPFSCHDNSAQILEILPPACPVTRIRPQEREKRSKMLRPCFKTRRLETAMPLLQPSDNEAVPRNPQAHA